MIPFPQSTIVNKPVPKTAFYRHLEVNARQKARFVEDIDRIVWLAKLTPSTLNIEDGKTVHELTVFLVTLKRENVTDDVFVAIDRQMPRHVLFILQFEESYCLLLNYKEWADPVKGTFRIVKSFRTDWTDGESLRLDIDGSNMDRLYVSFVAQVSGFNIHNVADIKLIIDLQQQLVQKQRAVEALQKKVRAERQFNRQMELNTEARTLKKEVAALQEKIGCLMRCE